MPPRARYAGALEFRCAKLRYHWAGQIPKCFLSPHAIPQISAERRDAHAQGHTEGYTEGLNSLSAFVASDLARRGIKVSTDFNARFKAVGPLTGEALLPAAQKCVSEQDFFSRLLEELRQESKDA